MVAPGGLARRPARRQPRLRRPRGRRRGALSGDLSSAPVPPPRPGDHARGPRESAETVLIYADFACPRCALAHERLRHDPRRVIFRHFALKAKHPRALALAHAAEAAARQGFFWQFADSLFAEQGRSDDPHLWERCERLGLDLERFERDRRSDEIAQHVHQDVRDALRAGATATPTLWVLGYHGSVRNIDVSDLAPRPTGGAGKAVPYEQ